MEEACIQEIHRLHDEFVKWFTASIPNTEDNFAPIASALSKDFHMVPPKGVLVSQPDLTNSLRNAYGCRKDSPFRIEIKNCKLLCDETKTFSYNVSLIALSMKYSKCKDDSRAMFN